MFRKLLVGTVCTLALLACGKSIDGLLTNKEALTFNVKNKTATIPAGRWETTIKFASKKEVKLDITIPGAKETSVSFKVPKSAPLPEENGSFALSSEQSGQPYDVKGTVSTTHKDSEEKWDWETCTYRVERQECYYQNGQQYCRWVYYDVHGQRDIRYFLRETTQEVNFDLISATASAPGSFHGVDRSTQRVYTYQGACR